VEACEFASRGIAFDFDRYTQSYITEPILLDIFKAETEFVKEHFLNPVRHGGWTLKTGFATQRQVERHFSGLEKTERNYRLKHGLYDLISNVILFAASENRFHFRFSMEDTLSFQSLDAGTRAGLKSLYNDYFFRRQDDFWRREALAERGAAKTAGLETGHQHAHLRRRPWPGA
jgi:4-alpha-glucanotransferase